MLIDISAVNSFAFLLARLPITFMRILLFIDSNIKTIPYEIPLLELKRKGHEIIFLSILKKGSIHDEYEKNGFPSFTMDEDKVTLKHLPQYLWFFQKFCRAKKINVVFAHLAVPSLIGVLTQRFLDAKIVCFRHHFNFVGLLANNQFRENKVEKIIDKINAYLSNTIVLPSTSLKDIIHKSEHVPLKKMQTIPYIYDWSRFLSKNAVSNNDDVLRLLMISRLTKLKRPELALEVLAGLLKRNIKVTLTILGTGDLQDFLSTRARELGVEEHIHFAGFQTDVLPFINNSDLLIHPSLTEASSSVIKEAGVLGRSAIVCKDVGDFNDYIINDVNGWLVTPGLFVKEAIDIILNNDHASFRKRGMALKQTIVNRFSLTSEVISSYEALLT